MNVKSNVQKLGRAMLLPVAAMPLAGLIMRLSADDMLNIPVIGAAGNAVFGNLDILFAIGVAIGFVKNKDKGIPALTGFLAIATLKKGLEIMDPEVNMGIFGGIISGLVAAWTYNRFINGDPQAGLFLSGFFVVMMFGIPAICLAIYKAAYKENKEMVKGIMGSGAGTSFIANITEPVEFSFMFLSPMLYVIHALFAGLAGIVCYLFNIRIGFTFGACIVDYLINFRIATNAILILPIGIFFFALYYVTFYYLINKRNIQTLGREAKAEFGNEVTLEETELGLASKNYEYMATKMLQAFGGKANILDVYSCNTRLRVEVVDPTMVEEQRIKQLGISGIIKPTEKNYQIIIGLEVTYVMAEFNKLLEE